jgi:hypothetical protein
MTLSWDKWDKIGWVRISRISRIRLGYPHGTYPEKGVFILNIYPVSKQQLDPCLAILVGPLDPVEYQDRFGYAMFDIQRYARAMYKP